MRPSTPPASNAPLVWYVTPHGYGHAARSCTIIRALVERHPEIPVLLCSTHPESFLHNRLPPSVRIRPVALDRGLVMHDSIRIDFDASLKALAELAEGHAERVRAEADFLARAGARLVAADIPPAALEAAAMAGVRAVGLGNFSWGWIYRHYERADPRWRPFADAARRGCARADLLLRYPAHEPMSDFPRIVDTPVPAAVGRTRREEMAARYGLDPNRRWVLMSFQTLDLPEVALRSMSDAKDIEWISVRPLEWEDRRGFTAVDRAEFPFADVLASSDLVLTKPGHGILCECLASRKPMVCVERPDWPENDVLMDAIRRYLPHDSLRASDFLRGLAPAAVEAVAHGPAAPEPPPPADPGQIAEMLVEQWTAG
ncbi:MAG: hypothetical protein KBA51_05960 [Kiritimatiellae bacterium]|nr:hypothetical protein [Kiritimatiellia bacterium]